jgi:hypothetical protein
MMLDLENLAVQFASPADTDEGNEGAPTGIHSKTWRLLVETMLLPRTNV